MSQTEYTIADLRDRLFATIDGVRDGKLTVEQARTVGELSQVIVNTAKVEIEFAKQAERKRVSFLADAGDAAGSLPALEAGGAPHHGDARNGIVSITRHVLQG